MPGRQPLREGFSTGSGAAAAAFAAVERLLSFASSPARVALALPPFLLENGQLRPERETRLSIPLHSVQLFEEPRRARAQVIKDGGDDPDATHGLLLEMWAAASAADLADLAGSRDRPAALQLENGVYLSTGPGVGRVTLPGLPVLPGQPAVNPEPRRQIAFAAREAALAAGYAGPIHLFLQVPEGEKAAARTLNARLGILGGISILGTRGTVRPYSHDAWQATIAQGLDIALALGLPGVAFSTGRNSEKALQGLFPELPPQAFIQAADYARFSIAQATSRAGQGQFEQIVWGCYAGKLLKLAQGLEYTHAASGAPDLPWLAALAREKGGTTELGASLAGLPTVRGAFDLLEKANPALALNILALVAKKALGTLTNWAAAPLAEKPAPRITLCVFRNNNSLWLRTDSYE